MTTKNKILSYLIAITAFIVAAVLYHAANLKGFPDGHLTELDRAERPLFYGSTVLALLAGLFFLSLPRKAKTSRGNKIFVWAVIVIVVLSLVLVALDWYFIKTLDAGQGG